MVLYEKLKYELELITPAFIGGAFPKEQAELRPASFIGVLRWWFRNLALTITDDIEVIYTLESELFGNTQRAGKVWVKFETIKNQDYEIFKQIYKNIDVSNLSYLGYGNFTYVNCSKQDSTKKYSNICLEHSYFKGNINVKAFIPAGTKVNLTLLVPKKHKNLLENFLFLVSQLGALGGRNRRGWGNFYLNPSNRKKEFWKPDQVKEAYENFVGELCRFIPRGNAGQVIRVYENNYNEPNPLEVLNRIGKYYKYVRNRYDCNGSKGKNFQWEKQYCDYSQVKDFLQRKHRFPTVIYNRAWFGLPIIVRYRSLKGKTATINVFQKNIQERLASPVIFRIFRNTKDEFGVLFIVFYRSEFYREAGKFYKWFLGKEREVRVSAKGLKPKPVVMNKSFEDFIEEFLRNLNVSTDPILTLGG